MVELMAVIFRRRIETIIHRELPMIKRTFSVPDMHCSNCSMKLESIEDLFDGIKEINASYHKQQMIVEFDETKVGEEQIIAAAKKKGYTAVLEQ